MSSRGQLRVDRDDRDDQTIVAVESDRCQVALLIDREATEQEVADLLDDAESEASWHARGRQA